MKTFRAVLFWAHLAAGLVAGLVIGVMCFTGAALAFEQEIIAWAEGDAREVPVPAGGMRRSLADLQQTLRAAHPEFRPDGLTLENRSSAAVAFTAGRNGGFYANPYTGEIRQPATARARGFMQVMTDWHRYLARSGDARPTGRLINGIANLAFCALAITGLYLWLPRTWSARGMRAIAVINFRAAGKARDFNWHNAIGLWSAPILIVLTLTAVPISFRWGGDLMYRLAGVPVPANDGPGGAATPAPAIARPAPDAQPVGPDAIVAAIQKEFPHWSQIALRTSGSGPQISRERGQAAPESGPTTPPLTVTVREAGAWPRTATTTLTLNPFTGEILNRTGFADLPTARQIRTWTRILHTGRALGWVGQLVAGLACIGGCALVYTGFALSWRRFFGRRGPTDTIPTA